MPTLVAEESLSQIANLNPIFGALGVKGKKVTTLSSNATIYDFIQSVIKTKPAENESPFSVLDLRVVIDLMNKWTMKLPTVKPFYAVKCNPNISLVGTLASLGSNFDCASHAEIESVLSLGVSPDRIIYANPCKSELHIKYAASVGVNLTTFDSVGEVEKIKKWHPKAYHGAILSAKEVFETASRLGMPKMKILDIGGGFTSGSKFDEAALNVNDAIKTHFGNDEDLIVIGEPGRYFSETAFTLATKIIGKRVRGELREYWINDGIYGTLSNVLFDSAILTCTPLRFGSKPENVTCKDPKTYPSTVFGPTCDGIDTVLKGYLLLELEVNDWLVFPNMGAYTISSGTNFNGFCSTAKDIYLACSSPVGQEQMIMF